MYIFFFFIKPVTITPLTFPGYMKYLIEVKQKKHILLYFGA